MTEQPASEVSVTIGQLLSLLFAAGRASNRELNEEWIKASINIGGALPRSLIMVSVQRLGEVDLVCRSVERELLTQPSQEGVMDFRPNYLQVLSEWWIGSAYAICFALKDRKLRTDDTFLRLADDLRLVRVQLEKYEIPSDRALSDPLLLSPTTRSDEEAPPIYRYDKNDPLKAHIPRTGMSERRSVMWEVIDTKTTSMRWLERTELSERFLNVLSKGTQP